MASTLKWLMAIVVFASMGRPAAAQIPAQAAEVARGGSAVDPVLRADIERLMDMTGASARVTQLARGFTDAFVGGLRQTQPSVSPRLVEVVGEVLGKEFEQAFNGPEIKDKQIALYARYFTDEDVKGMLAFYGSDLGKKTIAVMPDITRDGFAIGQQWAEANMPRVLERLETRLKSEGLLPATAKLH